MWEQWGLQLKAPTCCFLTLQPRPSHLTSLSLSFLVRNTGQMLQGRGSLLAKRSITKAPPASGAVT